MEERKPTPSILNLKRIRSSTNWVHHEPIFLVWLLRSRPLVESAQMRNPWVHVHNTKYKMFINQGFINLHSLVKLFIVVMVIFFLKFFHFIYYLLSCLSRTPYSFLHNNLCNLTGFWSGGSMLACLLCLRLSSFNSFCGSLRFVVRWAVKDISVREGRRHE